jgi:hypothetical protein
VDVGCSGSYSDHGWRKSRHVHGGRDRRRYSAALHNDPQTPERLIREVGKVIPMRALSTKVITERVAGKKLEHATRKITRTPVLCSY